MEDFISIKGAKIHNLKNIDVKIPKNKLTVITGVSGSGKSSLIADTLVPKLKEILKAKFLGGEDDDISHECGDVLLKGVENIKNVLWLTKDL